MRTNYQRGADKERRIMNKYRQAGWLSWRSAGSHSPIDVIAINPKTKEIILFQSKLGKHSKSQLKEIEDHGKALEGEYMLKFKLIERGEL